MKLVIFSSIVLLSVTIVLARSTDESHKRHHANQDPHVDQRHHDKSRSNKHITKKHRDHESQFRHSQHRQGCDDPPVEPSSTPFDDVGTTVPYDYSQIYVDPTGPPVSKRHKGSNRHGMLMRGRDGLSSRKSMKRDSQNIWESIGSLITCLPQIFFNVPNILLKELNEPMLKNRTLQLTINGQIVYSIVLDVQMSICANPNYDGCQNLTGIFDIPSIVLPNIVPDINNRVNCVRQIMCNVTQAIVTDISTRGFFSKREVVLKIDDNVIFRVVTGLLPSCDVGSSATARHRAIGLETKKRAQKKHSGHLKTKRASDYAPYDQGYELENGSPLDDGLEDSGDEIRED